MTGETGKRKRTERLQLCPFILGFPRCRYSRGEIFSIFLKLEARQKRCTHIREALAGMSLIQYLCQTIQFNILPGITIDYLFDGKSQPSLQAAQASKIR